MRTLHLPLFHTLVGTGQGPPQKKDASALGDSVQLYMYVKHSNAISFFTDYRIYQIRKLLCRMVDGTSVFGPETDLKWKNQSKRKFLAQVPIRLLFSDHT